MIPWRPVFNSGVFASGGEDHLIAVWDLERRGDIGGEGEAQPEPKRARTAIPPQLMFQHAGHRSQVIYHTQSAIVGSFGTPYVSIRSK